MKISLLRLFLELNSTHTDFWAGFRPQPFKKQPFNTFGLICENILFVPYLTTSICTFYTSSLSHIFSPPLQSLNFSFFLCSGTFFLHAFVFLFLYPILFINLLGIDLFLFLVSCISLPYTCIPFQSFFFKENFNSWAFVLFCLLPFFLHVFGLFQCSHFNFHLLPSLSQLSLAPLFLPFSLDQMTDIDNNHFPHWFLILFNLLSSASRLFLAYSSVRPLFHFLFLHFIAPYIISTTLHPPVLIWMSLNNHQNITV